MIEEIIGKIDIEKELVWLIALHVKKEINSLNIIQEGGGYQEVIELDDIFHKFYKEKTGVFDVRYIPIDLYYCFIDPYYNNWSMASVVDNKCQYRSMFNKIKQPTTYFCRVNNIWTDNNFNLVKEETIIHGIKNLEEIVIKQANESEGGKNIFFIKIKDNESLVTELNNAISSIKKDIVIQESIKQNEVLKTVNPTSINTIRILSLLNQNEVKIYSAILRMGIDNKRVDNISQGGLACGISKEGRLRKYAYNYRGEKFNNHPSTGIVFHEIVVPNFDKVCELVKSAHPYIPNFRLVSWDICIDYLNNPLLLEANLCYGELNLHQLCNGPVFKDDTQKILNEVFK